jgi:Xanthomonas XOO_2897-like deaminase
MICDDTTKIDFWNPIAADCVRLRQLYGLPRHMGGYGLGSLAGRNCAIVWFDHNGNVQHVTCSSEAARQLGYSSHSEKACFHEIQHELDHGAQVVQVYTERFPCGPHSGQNCYDFLEKRIGQHVRVFWSYPYPDVSDFTTKRKREDPDEYDREGKRAKKERDLFNRQVRRSVKAFSEPGTWGTGTAYS